MMLRTRSDRRWRWGPAGWCILAGVVLLAAPAHAESGTRRALLIGIADYAALPDLPGATNDIEMMRRLLETRLGFDPAEIRTLMDAEATREGMLAGLRALAESVRPGDVVYVHYSGHGSRVPDQNGDESDGLDETLVPQDGRTPGVADITDDELGEILASMASDDVVVVLDSCHSGTATRGLESPITTRAVPTDMRAELYPQAIVQRSVVEIDTSRLVLFTGAADDESAIDAFVDGRRYGIFSYALGRSLAALGSTAPPRRLLARAGRELTRVQEQLSLPTLPDPQLEGPASRLDLPLIPTSMSAEVSDPPAPVAPPSPAPPPAPLDPPTPTPSVAPPVRLPWLEARPVGAREVELLEATSLGAEPGSSWAIYPPGELAFPIGGAVARVLVHRVEGNVARATVQLGGKIEPASRAIRLLSPPPPTQDWLRWRAGKTSERKKIAAALRRLGVRAAFTEDARLARLSIEHDGRQVRVFGLDGTTLLETLEDPDPARVAEAIAARLRRSLMARELLALDNPATAISLRFEVVGRESLENEMSARGSVVTRAIQLVADTGPAPIHIRQPEEPRTPQNSLQLRFESDRPCYLTLIDLDARGEVMQMFPNPISERRGFLPDGRIESNEAVLIPDALSAGNRAGFFIDYAPPVGRDTLLALCVERPELAQAMRSKLVAAAADVDRSRGADAPGAGGAFARASESIAELATRGFVRLEKDASADALPASDWATASVTIEVFE